MSNHNDDEINFSKLEKELANAIEADKKYWRENDAKIRAVEQRVGSYEEFKDMVAAAHLKPLDRKSDVIVKDRIVQTWNSAAAKNDSKVGRCPTSDELNDSHRQDKLPENSLEFERLWKRLTSTVDRYRLLCGLKGERMLKLFKTDVSNLNEILQALNEGYQTVDASIVYDILYHIAKCERFRISVMFLDSKDKICGFSLLSKLKNDLSSQEEDSKTNSEQDLNELIKKYDL